MALIKISRKSTLPTHYTVIISLLSFVAANARWAQNGVTVAGGHGEGGKTNQLNYPFGLCVDDEDTVIVADRLNHRIVEWKRGATSGTVLAGGNEDGDRPDQLNCPTDVIFDKETDSLIICEQGNRRHSTVEWHVGHVEVAPEAEKGSSTTSIVSDWRWMMRDHSMSLTWKKHEVRRYRRGETNGTVVAGRNGQGAALNQLNEPRYVCVDGEHAVYVSDQNNHRVMKWVKGAKEGIVVAGGRGQGKDLTQLSYPNGVRVDAAGNVYVADSNNHRVMRWCRGATQGTVVVGGNGAGRKTKSVQWCRRFVLQSSWPSLCRWLQQSSSATFFAWEELNKEHFLVSLYLPEHEKYLAIRARDQKTVSGGGRGR